MVSIIIPIYNVEKYVKKCLESAFNQTFEDIEYILIDDCGSDNSMIIVNKVVNLYPNKKIKIIHHKCNMGLSAARNTGLMNSHGEYIFFLDSDDYISKDCIRIHYKYIRRFDLDFTDANILVNKKNNLTYYKYNKIIDSNDIKLIYFFKRRIRISAWNKLIRRSILIENNILFFNDIYHEDVIWSYLLIRFSRKFGLINDETYHYVIHSNSITTSSNLINITKKINSWNYIFEYFINIYSNENNLKLKKIIYKWLNKRRFITCLNLIIQPLKKKNIKLLYEILNKEFYKLPITDIYSLFCNFNFRMFNFIFRLPSKLLYKIR